MLAIFYVVLIALISPAFSIESKDFLVEGLDEIYPIFATFPGQMHAGLMPINTGDGGSLMFWLFEPYHPVVHDTLIIWFNGGPGCSSFDAGLLLETGPVAAAFQPAGAFGQQDYNEKLGFNEYAWTKATAIMYVEQPVGVGFSHGTDPPTNEEEVASDFYRFLKNFYTIFPMHASKRLFLFGESYAGMYVPSMAHYIYKQNKRATEDRLINLQGIALGNGWADSMIQGGMVIDYAWWHGMIDSVTRDALHLEWEHCKQRTGQEPDPFHPFTTPDDCGTVEAVLRAAGGGLLGESRNPNMYDVTTFDTYKVLTAPGNTFEQFFSNPHVQQKLNIPSDRIGQKWVGCIPGAGRRRMTSDEDDLLPGQLLLKDDVPLSMGPYLSELLDQAKIRVLIYNGDRDMSTCSQGSELMLDQMKWSGSEDWYDPNSYKRSLWMVNDYPAGWVKTVKNLDFVVVYNSGHLVPYNVPAQSLDLVTRFLSNQSYGDVEIPVVFDPVVLGNSFSSQAADDSSYSVRIFGLDGVFSILLGFIVGVASVLVYQSCDQDQHKRNRPQPGYENIGDVDNEELGLNLEG